MRSIPGKKYVWSKSDIAFLRHNYKAMNSRQMGEILGIGITLVRMKRYELGLYKMRLEYWTPEQVKYLIEHYKFIGDKEFRDIFNRRWPKKKGWSHKHIEKKRKYLKLKRTERQIFNIRIRNIDQGRLVNYNWVGKHLRRRVRIGTCLIRTQHGYKVKFIKVKGGYARLSRFLWQKEHGPVPRGKMLILKDGNPNHVTLENILCVSRAQFAERMRNSDRAIASLLSMQRKSYRPGLQRRDMPLFHAILKHPELIEAKRQQLKLNRILNEREQAV